MAGHAVLTFSLLATGIGTARAQAVLAPYNPTDNDQLTGAQIVNAGNTLTLTGPQQFQPGDSGARDTTLGTLRDAGRIVSGSQWVGAGRLNPGTMNFGVTVPDPITGGTRVASTYNTGNLNPLTPVDWSNGVPDLVEVNDGQYVNARIGTVDASGGTLNVNIGTPGAASTATTNGWTMALKQSALFHADGTAGQASDIHWQSSNRISFIGNAAAPNTPNQQSVTYVSQYGGTFNVITADGATHTHTVSNDGELRTYNDWLIGQLRAGNLDPTQYSGEFGKAYSSATQTISYNVTAANPADEIFQSMGERVVIRAVGASATGTIDAGAKLEVDNANGGVMRAESGGRLVNNGTLASIHTVGDGSAMVLTGSSSGQNAGVINGNFFLNDDGSIVNGNYGGNIVNVLEGSNFDNSGIINLATGSANGAGASAGIHLGTGASATSSGIINVGVTGSRSNGSMTGVRVDGDSGGFTNTGTVYLGRGPQSAAGQTPADVAVNQGSVTAGITVNGDGTAENAGNITIGSLTQNAAGLLVDGGANATVTNSGTIDINGRASAVPRDNIGISVINAGSGGGIANTGTINLNGVNGVGIKVVTTGSNSANASSSGVINVAGAADPASGTRNFGVWAEGRGSQAARATVGGQVNLLGDGAIGIHARGFSVVDVAASAVPSFANGRNQIAFFAYGSGARINVASPSLEVTTEDSTLFRMENGASFDGTGLTLIASGRGSQAVVGTGAPSVVNTNGANIQVSGEGAAGVIIEGGATGNIDAGTNIQLTGTGAVAAIADGQKHSLTGAATGSPNAATSLTSAAALSSGQANLTGYIARNSANLTNTGNIDFSGAHATGIQVESGATATNSGNISITDGGTGIRVDGSGTRTTTANSTGQILINGGNTGDRSRGIVATGAQAVANLQGGASLQMLGTGAIGAEAINGGVVNVAAGAVPSFGNSDQIAFHAQGAGSAINSAASAIDASTADSAIYRIDDGATLSLSGSSALTASGDGAKAIIGSGPGTQITTGTATLNVSGNNAVGIDLNGGASGTLSAGTTVDLSGAGAVGGVVDGQRTDLSGAATGTAVATTLTNDATVSGGGAGATGFITRNQGSLSNTAAIAMTGDNATGVWLQDGGGLDNTGRIQVANGTGVRIEGAHPQPVMIGAVTVDDGVAGVHLLNGAEVTIDDANADITTHGGAHGVLVGAGAASLSLANATITTDGTGNGIENAAEISAITLQNATIQVGDGAGIRTATAFDPASTVTVDVEGAGTGLAFRNADGTTASGNLALGEGYAINANGAGATGIQALTSGSVDTAATVQVAAGGGSALVAGTASRTTNTGTLTSASTAAPVVDLANGDGTQFANRGVIEAADSTATAVRGSAGSDAIELSAGRVRGDITTGDGSDTFLWTGGSLDGSLTMGNGSNNQATVQGVDLSTTTHLTAGSGAGNVLNLNAVQASGGSFGADDPGRGVNLGNGWSTINLAGSELTLSDDLQTSHGAGTVNIDATSTLFAGNSVNPVVAGSVSNSGLIDLTNGSGSPGNRLTVAGAYAGQGTVALASTLNEGGVLGNQFTDRLLVQGNASGATVLRVTVAQLSTGALTDLNHDANPQSNEGISLVQVGGVSAPGAFALEGDYLAAGPWRYDLYSFAPGQSDATQRVVDGSGNGYWDYRLANTYVCPEEGCAPRPAFQARDLGGGVLGNPADDGCVVDGIDTCSAGRRAVIPQVPSYISAPVAMAGYGAHILDNLHKRLGEIRHDSQLEDGIGGEVFARAIGGDYRYKTDQAFNRFGYDFDLNMQALQLGATLIDANRAHSSMRVGLAFTHGNAWLKPKAADGYSRTKFDNDSLGVYLTWLHESGFYLDAIVSHDRYRGDVSIANSAETARMRSSGWTASLESGYPFEFDNGWLLEPQLQLTQQDLHTKDFVDSNGARVSYEAYDQTVGRAGLRLSRRWDNGQGRLATPWLRVNYIRGIGDEPAQVRVSDESGNFGQNFYGGRYGRGWEYGLGGTWSYSNRLSLYGELDYRQDSGDSGLRGWGGNLGLRWNF